MKNEKKNKSLSEILNFNSAEDELLHDASMISLQFISEINKVLQEHNINKKELAEKIGISPSYVTQLFSGDKKVNCEILAKFQKALRIKYVISAISEELDVNGYIED